MSDLLRSSEFRFIEDSPESNREALLTMQAEIEALGYEIVESDTTKPWGAYFRVHSEQAENFLLEFFPGVSIEEARLGIENAELSPKILTVLPGQRLSWQYHARRAERWRFLTQGGYRRSVNDMQGGRIEAQIGDEVQFGCGERHRLEGSPASLTIVAEIWQHTNRALLSDEEDIVRLSDDYNR